MSNSQSALRLENRSSQKMQSNWSYQKLFLTLLVGAIVGFSVGICVSYIEPADWENFRSKLRSFKNVESAELKSFEDDHHHLYNVSAAETTTTEKPLRLLCWIMTNPDNHKTKALYIKWTWSKRCDKVLFMSSAPDSELDTIALPVEEGRENLWNKVREAFKYIYTNHLNDYDWFLRADDDTYVIVENLRQMLKPYSPTSPIYFGCKFKLPGKHNQGYMSGGAGYVLSRESVRRLIEVALPNKDLCDPTSGVDDVELGLCLEKVNVTIADSRDGFGLNRFFPLTPEQQIKFNGIFPDDEHWYWKYRHYDTPSGTKKDYISNKVISFHYVTPDQMLVFEMLLYRITVMGRTNSDYIGT